MSLSVYQITIKRPWREAVTDGFNLEQKAPVNGSNIGTVTPVTAAHSTADN